jgi:hypothetical protein
MDTHASLSASDVKTILVVDDDPSMMLICTKTLRAEGFTVLEAEGSSEALKILTLPGKANRPSADRSHAASARVSTFFHQKSVSTGSWS